MFQKQDIPILDTLGALFRGDFGGFVKEGLQDLARLWQIWVWWLVPHFVADQLGITRDGSALSVLYTASAPLVLMPAFVWFALRTRGGHRANLTLSMICLSMWFWNFHADPTAYGFGDLTEFTISSVIVYTATLVAALMLVYATWMVYLDTPAVQSRHAIRNLLGLRELDGGARWATQSEMSRRFDAMGGIVIAQKVVGRI